MFFKKILAFVPLKQPLLRGGSRSRQSCYPAVCPGAIPLVARCPDFFKGLSYSPLCAFPGLLLCPGLRSPQQTRGKSPLTARITFLCVPCSLRAGPACA